MSLIACSGPGASELIARNIDSANDHALLVAGALVASLLVFGLIRVKWFPLICLGLFVIHPAWTVSALMGDCGFLKVTLAKVFSAAAVTALTFQTALAVLVTIHWMRRRISPPQPEDER